MEFRDLPFELWKVAKYANDTISFEKIITEKDRDDYNKSDFYSIPIHKEDDLDKVFLLLSKIVD